MKPKKILLLPRYSRMGASSRLRTYQYVPFLKTKGIEVTVSPLFNDRYLKELYAGKGTSWRNILHCYWGRLITTLKATEFDQIVIEKELFPFFPSWLEWWLYIKGKSYVVDYDDAVFHNYDLHQRFWVRWLLRNKIDKVMRYSKRVLAGNEYLQEKAMSSGAKEVVILPTVVDGSRYFPVEKKCENKLVKVGWIGSPSTLKYVKEILPVLNKVNEKYPFELVIIGGGAKLGFSGKETQVVWSEEKEVSEIQKLDIGIMPLSNTPWEKGKCGYKLIQYMACGLPVVGSPIGFNQKLIFHGRNGFLPNDPLKWEQCLKNLLSDRTLRKQMGEEGYSIIHQKYVLQELAERYLYALQ